MTLATSAPVLDPPVLMHDAAVPTRPSVIGEPTGVALLRTTADPRKEYVAGAGNPFLQGFVQALQRPIDDLDAEFAGIWDQMLLDPAVRADSDELLMGAFAEPLQIAPARSKDKPGGALAAKIHDATVQMIDQLETPLEQVLYELAFGAFTHGHKLAEQMYAIRTLDPAWGPLLVLTDLRCKPDNRLAFVVDAYKQLVGILYAPPGMPLVPLASIPLGDGPIPYLLPPEKFAKFAWQPQNSDPRGTSALRSCYHAWYFKLQCWLPYLAHLATFGQPSIVGTTAPNAQPVAQYNPDGSPQLDAFGHQVYLTPEQVLQQVLAAVKNGSDLAMPFGSLVSLLQARGEGAPFLAALEKGDQQISLALLHQGFAVGSGVHGQTRDASITAQDSTGLLIRFVKVWIVSTFRNEILKPWVRYNWGADAVALTPYASLGAVEHQDFSGDAHAVAQLVVAGFFAEEQYPELDAMFNRWSVRDPDAWAAVIAANRAAVPPDTLTATAAKSTAVLSGRRAGRQMADRLTPTVGG